ncbi:MAG: bacterioferritin [Candidatus Aegiribacteria sp. MLS_C]|nr:MAG: bacterioferritin [Candidatus Aegiribacteria sp. MLS_C]
MAENSREERRQAVIEVLNEARKMELHAIVQYMNQHYGLDDMDYGELAGKIKLIAIDEMKHAEDFAERIKELGGEPTTDRAAEVVPGQAVEKIFKFDSGLEDDTIDRYSKFEAVCRENGDTITAKLFERIIDEEQIHLNYFDDIDDHIEKLGKNFLARKAGTPSDTGLTILGFVAQQGGE